MGWTLKASALSTKYLLSIILLFCERLFCIDSKAMKWHEVTVKTSMFYDSYTSTTQRMELLWLGNLLCCFTAGLNQYCYSCRIFVLIIISTWIILIIIIIIIETTATQFSAKKNIFPITERFLLPWLFLLSIIKTCRRLRCQFVSIRTYFYKPLGVLNFVSFKYQTLPSAESWTNSGNWKKVEHKVH